MANTLNFNGFEVWLQLTSDESIFPLAESSIIGNTISVTVPLKICRKPFEVAYRRTPDFPPISAWFNIIATSARTEKRAFGFMIKDDSKSQQGVGIPIVSGETFNLPRWSKSHGNRPEVLAEVKVEIYRAKDAVLPDDLRDRNNVQDHLIDKFDDGPYAAFEFSFKDGREPIQITSPISTHASAPNSESVARRTRPPHSSTNGGPHSSDTRLDASPTLTGAPSISSGENISAPPLSRPPPRIGSTLHVSSSSNNNNSSPPLVTLASTTNNNAAGLGYTHTLKPLIDKFGSTSKNLNPSAFQSFTLKRKASFSSDGEDVDHLDPDSPIRKKQNREGEEDESQLSPQLPPPPPQSSSRSSSHRHRQQHHPQPQQRSPSQSQQSHHHHHQQQRQQRQRQRLDEEDEFERRRESVGSSSSTRNGGPPQTVSQIGKSESVGRSSASPLPFGAGEEDHVMGDAEDVGEREGEREKERDGEGEGDGDGDGEGDGDGDGGEEGEERKSVLCGGASRRRSDPVERLVAELGRAKSERRKLEAQLKAQIAEERARIARIKAVLSSAS